uniref:Uncharacterized protein ycf35 n=1 Tax=Leptosiphonia brodiei TaxID=2608611 RepID=A0A1Z1MAJ0_9FLOR|nr:hypothetical protein [Leptosiphonia brodiei]ARW62825.1 hypothetical protein [Leptosiphonia brodiei]
MSHFSKIKTSITNLKLLKKTVKDLGFLYKISSDKSIICDHKTLFVYDLDRSDFHTPSCSFQWNVDQYLLIVDLGLWNSDIDFNYFTERLLQQYAYNVVIEQGYAQGFSRVTEHLKDNGCISLVLQRF